MAIFPFLNPSDYPSLSESGYNDAQGWIRSLERKSLEVLHPCYFDNGSLSYSELARSDANQYQRFRSDLEDHLKDGCYRAKMGLAFGLLLSTDPENIIVVMKECEHVVVEHITFGLGYHSYQHPCVTVPMFRGTVQLSPDEVLEFIEGLDDMDLSVDADALMSAVNSKQSAIAVSDDLTDAEKKRMVLKFLREDKSYANENGSFGLLQITDKLGIGYKDVETIIEESPEEIENRNFRAKALFGHTFPIEFHQTIIPMGVLHCDVTEEEYKRMIASGRLKSDRYSKVHLYSDEPYLSRPQEFIRLDIDAPSMVADGHQFYRSGRAIFCEEVPFRYIRRGLVPSVGKVRNRGAPDE